MGQEDFIDLILEELFISSDAIHSSGVPIFDQCLHEVLNLITGPVGILHIVAHLSEVLICVLVDLLDVSGKYLVSGFKLHIDFGHGISLLRLKECDLVSD